jgi:hypothetical protein
MLDITIPITPAPAITEPNTTGTGRAPWPVGDLVVEWPTRMGIASAEIVVRFRDDANADEVRCYVRDDGQFTVPASLVAPYRGAFATLELAQVTMEEQDVDGFAMRVGTRSSTGIQLIPRTN